MKKNLLVAIIFGIVSIPWTYFFGVFNLVLWPSFIASASFFAAGAGLKGFYKSYVNNLLGIIYAILTILIAQMFGNSLFWLSFYVGLFMFIASLVLTLKIRRHFSFDVIDAHYVYPDGTFSIFKQLPLF